MLLMFPHQVKATDGFYGGDLGYGRRPGPAYASFYGPGLGTGLNPGFFFPNFGRLGYRGLLGRGQGLGFGGFGGLGYGGLGRGLGFLRGHFG